MSCEWWKKYRPNKLQDVVGQHAAVTLLTKHLKDNTTPHALMFVGPSGTGKTTTARILKDTLGISDMHSQDINCATCDPLDMVRDVARQSSYSVRQVWIFDEFQSLSRAKFAQQGLLNILEDTGDDRYYILCTTDPGKILPTIKNRCTTVNFSPLTNSDGHLLIDRILKAEKMKLFNNTAAKILEVAQGSARMIVKLLETVSQFDTEKEQLDAIHRGEEDEVGIIDLCRALLNPARRWPDVAKILRDIQEERAEDVQMRVLEYFNKVLIGGSNKSARAAAVISIFRDEISYLGMALIAENCYRLMNEPRR